MEKNKNISPFKIPENYFEKLNEEINAKIIEDSLVKDTGFKIPDNYLTNFRVKINEPKVIFINYPLFTKIAAAIILLVSITFIVTKNNSVNTDLLSLNEDELNYWIDYELDFNDLLDYTDDIDIEIEIDNELNIQTNDIIEYFEYHDIENILENNKINTL